MQCFVSGSRSGGENIRTVMGDPRPHSLHTRLLSMNLIFFYEETIVVIICPKLYILKSGTTAKERSLELLGQGETVLGLLLSDLNGSTLKKEIALLKLYSIVRIPIPTCWQFSLSSSTAALV